VTPCWACGQERAVEAALCPHCGKVQPPPARKIGDTSVRDRFAVLGVERTFDLDLGALEQRYRELSRKLHPDRFVRATPQERRFSLEQTTLVNDAYRVLKDAVRRAEHLLELRGVHLGEAPRVPGQAAQEKLQMPPEFLEQAMEDREQLLEAKASGDPAAVEKLAAGVRQKHDETLEAVATRLRGNGSADPNETAQLLARLRYYARYLDEVEGRSAEI
jgi:molecular chaperone HscB